MGAEKALEHDPRNTKAAYRRAQALLELPGASRRQVSDAEKAAATAAELEPKDKQVADMLRRARERLEGIPPDADGYADAEQPLAAKTEEVAEVLDSMD